MMHTKEAFLGQLIKNHYRSALDMAVAAIIHAVLAVIICLGLPVLLRGSAEKNSGLLSILGGGILGTLGYSPFKEVLDHRGKARKLEAAQLLIKEAQQNEATIDIDEQQRINEALLKLIETTISI